MYPSAVLVTVVALLPVNVICPPLTSLLSSSAEVVSLASVIIPELTKLLLSAVVLFLEPLPRLSVCASNPTVNGPSRFIVVALVRVDPAGALSNVAILEPPTKKT